MILNITISDTQGIVKGQYKVTSEEPDTIQEMEDLELAGLEDRNTILDTIKQDLVVWISEYS